MRLQKDNGSDGAISSIHGNSCKINVIHVFITEIKRVEEYMDVNSLVGARAVQW